MGVFKNVFFSRAFPLVRKGYHQQLMMDDLPAQEKGYETTKLMASVIKSCKSMCEQKLLTKFVLARSLMDVLGSRIYEGKVLFLISNICRIFAPIALKPLMIALEDGDVRKGSLYSFVCFAMLMGNTFSMNAYVYRVTCTGLKIRTILASMIFQKSMVLDAGARKEYPMVRIVNMMDSDTFRVDMVTWFFNYLWSAPLQIIIVSIELCWLLGSAALAGVLLMLVLVPCLAKISTIQGKY